jgi:hypothetical protein
MRRTGSQSGEGKVGCIIWGALLAAAVLIGFKTIPVKIATSELYDYMDEQAKWGANSPPDQIKGRIYGKAKELDLPLDPRDLLVERNGDNIKMRAVFTVPLEFPGYVYYWNFDLQINRAIFIF